MSTVIKVENVSKQYRLGAVGSKTLSGDVQRLWAKVRKKEDPFLKIGSENNINTTDEEYVWALRNIDLEVKQGEVIGIIGKNGAGKSTLLKLLSRVTSPTLGEIKIKGRVASLLEVGTGFHQELTGRENIFLSGAILGMVNNEIKRKFDEIVDFSGVEKYIDTPIKRYSSGMYVRLAFAVAAHLESEILIVDEVLAVGDVEFQRKCLGKMNNVANEGRTILFVSHNMGTISLLCNKGLYLELGQINFIGEVQEAIELYIRKNTDHISSVTFYNDENNEKIQFKSIMISDETGEPNNIINFSSPISIVINFLITDHLERVAIVCHVFNNKHVRVLTTGDIDCYPELLEGRQKGIYKAIITIPPYLIAPGNYSIELHCGVPNMHLIGNIKNGPNFEITDHNTYASKWSMGRRDVVIGTKMNWRIVNDCEKIIE